MKLAETNSLLKIFFFKKNVLVLQIFQAVDAKTIIVTFFNKYFFFHRKSDCAAHAITNITHVTFKETFATCTNFLFMQRHVHIALVNN
jgi:hypothetical protein